MLQTSWFATPPTHSLVTLHPHSLSSGVSRLLFIGQAGFLPFLVYPHVFPPFTTMTDHSPPHLLFRPFPTFTKLDPNKRLPPPPLSFESFSAHAMDT